MPKRIPTAEGAVLRYFRHRKGATREELAEKAGVSPATIGVWELGHFKLERERLVEILSLLDVPREAVDAALLSDELAPGGPGRRTLLSQEDGLIEQAAVAAGWAATKAARPGLKADLLRRQAPRHREWAQERWSRLKKLPARQQEKVVDVLLGDDRSWALAERLCLASTAAAANRADEALRLARLAVHIAEHVPDPSLRLRLLGWVEPFLANALRVGGDLAASAQVLAHADELWEQGAAGAPAGLLDETRRLDLKASLLMYYGRFEEVHSLLADALQGARTEQARARLLIKQARNLEFAGQYEAAIEALREVKPLIDAKSDPRLVFAHDFNKTVSLLHLDRYGEAALLLPRVAALTDPGNELDGVRLRWLQGRTWAGLGRRAEAVAALSQVREYFLSERIVYDFAMVSVELGTLYLEQGRTRQVPELAERMMWIFDSQGVHKEALAALALFCQAAQAGEVQAEWTRRLVKYLYRAEHNPNLKFEP